jgi:hypothetical protein
MVRVTKGVGKRLQLRVEFDSRQQQLMQAYQPVPTITTITAFDWQNFVVTLEELSLANGSVVSEKPCELDMMELLSMTSPGNPNGEEPTFVPVTEVAYDLTFPLVAQCELKLFHLSKTLRFRVEYRTANALLTGYSLVFFTHDSGKSKKVAFNSGEVSPHVPHQSTSGANASTNATASNASSHSAASKTTQQQQQQQQQQLSTHHNMELIEDHYHHDFSTPHSEHDESSSHSNTTSPHHHMASPSGFEASEDSGNLEASSSSSCSGSGLLTPSDSSTLMDIDTISREFNSDHEGTPYTSSPHAGSIESANGTFFDSFSSSSTVGAPAARHQNGSASSSLSSDDGSAHMHAHYAAKRTSGGGSKKSHRPKARRSAAHASSSSSSSSTAAATTTIDAASEASQFSRNYDAIDEDIDRQLSGRSSSKKRKPSEMSSVPVSPPTTHQPQQSEDFPYVVDSNLDVHGIVRAQAFVHFSDMRFKTNVEEITDALNIVQQLKGKKYEWKDNINGVPTSEKISGGRKVIGLIAQEVKRVLPEVVVADKNGYLSLNYTDMVPVLIEALKQHVEASKQDKSEIKDSISELRAMVDELSQRSGDTLTDTSSYVDFSDDDEGSFHDEDWGSLSDSHGSYNSRSAGSRSSFNKRRSSRASSVSSSAGVNEEGDLTASCASLPDDDDGLLGGSSSPNSSLLRTSIDSSKGGNNLNVPKVGSSPGARQHNGAEKAGIPRKAAPIRKGSSNAILPPRPFVTLVACMTHKRLASMGSSQQSTGHTNNQPSPFTVVSSPPASSFAAAMTSPSHLPSSSPSSTSSIASSNTTTGNATSNTNMSSAPIIALQLSSPSSSTTTTSAATTTTTISSSTTAMSTLSASAPSVPAPGNTNVALGVGSVAAVKKSESSGLTKVDSTVISKGKIMSGSSSSSSLASPLSSSSSSSSSSSVAEKEKDKDSAPGSQKRTATQRLSRGFTSLLHHIQTSTSNIMNSAANFTKSSSSSSAATTIASAPSANQSNNTIGMVQSSSPLNNDDDGPLVSDGEGGGNLSSSSSSVSSNGSSASSSTNVGVGGVGVGVGGGGGAPLSQSLSQQMSALSLSSSTSEVRAQVLAPGFTRLTPTSPIKICRTVHRAVVITVSAWHMWSNADEEKLFLDESDARHSLVITGKAVSQIESTFPECSYIHTVSVDMRGTVQQTVEDVLIDLQRRQVPSGDSSSTASTPITTGNASSAATTIGSMSASVQSQLEQADLVWLIGHSQGVQVCVHLVDRLVRNGVLSSGEQLINVLSLGGLHNSCAYSLMSLHGNPAIYAALHNFGNSRRNFREYKQALARLLETGVPVTTVGAYQDTLINMASSSLEYVRHPNILRALMVHHEFRDKFDPKHAFKKASNFTQEMTRFALEMRNKNRIVDMLAFVNSSDTSADVQETTSWISHAKTFPRDKLHQLLYSPHIEFPATVPGFYYALGATMSMFNTRAFRFHKTTRQLREGIQRHREIPFAQDCYRVSLEWMLTRVSQGSPASSTSGAPSSSSANNSSIPTSPPSPEENPPSPTRTKRSKSSKRSGAAKQASATPSAPAYPPLSGVSTAFKENSNGFSFDFAEQVQLIASQCSKAETLRLQSAFRYWRPEGPKELLMQKLVTKSLGWSVSESPTLAQYVDGISDIVRDEKDKDNSALVSSSSSSAPPPLSSSPSSPAASPSSTPMIASSAVPISPRGSRKEKEKDPVVESSD